MWDKLWPQKLRNQLQSGWDAPYAPRPRIPMLRGKAEIRMQLEVNLQFQR